MRERRAHRAARAVVVAMRGVRHGERIGKIIGLIPTLGSLAIAIGYAVVLGWACNYFVASLDGELMAQTDMGAFFGPSRRTSATWASTCWAWRSPSAL